MCVHLNNHANHTAILIKNYIEVVVVSTNLMYWRELIRSYIHLQASNKLVSLNRFNTK